MSWILKNEDEYQYLTDKGLVNWETEMNSLMDLVNKEHLIQLLDVNKSFKQLRMLYNLKMRGRKKTISEDIAEIKLKKKIKKKLLQQILNISNDDMALDELQIIYRKNIRNIYLEKMEKEYQIKRKLMLKKLKMDETSIISEDELTQLYENKINLINRLDKESSEFLKEYYKTKEEISTVEDEDKSIYDNYEYSQGMDSILHNPGGAIIHTRSNAMDVMTFNEETGIYEQF